MAPTNGITASKTPIFFFGTFGWPLGTFESEGEKGPRGVGLDWPPSTAGVGQEPLVCCPHTPGFPGAAPPPEAQLRLGSGHSAQNCFHFLSNLPVFVLLAHMCPDIEWEPTKHGIIPSAAAAAAAAATSHTSKLCRIPAVWSIGWTGGQSIVRIRPGTISASRGVDCGLFPCLPFAHTQKWISKVN